VNTEVLIEKWFNKKISLERIEKHCQQLRIKRRRILKNIDLENIRVSRIKRRRILENIDLENIRVSCVQRQIRPVNSIERYIDLLCGFVGQAAKNNSHLIIFPEYNFFDLFGLIPGFCCLNQILNKRAIKAKDREKYREKEIGEDREEKSDLKENNHFLTTNMEYIFIRGVIF